MEFQGAGCSGSLFQAVGRIRVILKVLYSVAASCIFMSNTSDPRIILSEIYIKHCIIFSITLLVEIYAIMVTFCILPSHGLVQA